MTTFLRSSLLVLCASGWISAAALTDDAQSLDGVLTQFNMSALTAQVKENYATLNAAYETRGANRLYKFLGALMMTGNSNAIKLHDNILASGYKRNNALLNLIGLRWGDQPLHAHDEHILSVRYKVDSLLEGQRINNQAISQAARPFVGFQRCLIDSITPVETRSLTEKPTETLGQIIQSVYLPNTLLLGMDPFQKSVVSRQNLFYNPRVQFVDGGATGDFNHFKRELPPCVLEDLKRRTLCLNYGDNEGSTDFPQLDGTPNLSMNTFVQGHKARYDRMIFDWSCLCGVNSFNFIQDLLKPFGSIYTHGSRGWPVDMMFGAPIDVKQLPEADQWILLQSKHPFSQEAFYQYQRNNELCDHLKEVRQQQQGMRRRNDLMDDKH